MAASKQTTGERCGGILISAQALGSLEFDRNFRQEILRVRPYNKDAKSTTPALRRQAEVENSSRRIRSHGD